MYPRLFTVGPITVYSFGLMMSIGFFVASLLLHKETTRKNMMLDFSAELLLFLRSSYVVIVAILFTSYISDYGINGISTLLETHLTRTVLILAGVSVAGFVLFGNKSRSRVAADTSAFIVYTSIIAGVSGSKLLYVVENLPYVFDRPFEMIFSPGGLTWYGGFILVTIVIYYFTKTKGISFLRICDAAAPSLMIGYAIARIGCHLAGDGDYGMPTTLPWATVYSNGTYPPSVAFKNFPEIIQQYGVNGMIPDTIPLHPAPLYEFLAGIILFIVLWKFRTSLKRNGQLFMLYLVLAGIARLSVEFIRLNPRILLGFTEAQLFSIVMIIAGIIGLTILKKPKHLNSPVETA